MYPFANWRGRIRFPNSRGTAGSRSDGPIGGKEENTCPETTSGDPDPFFFPLPPSPPYSPPPLTGQAGPVQPPDDPQEVGPFFHYDDLSPPDDWGVASPSGDPRLPTTTDIALTIPPPD